jgi:uncharacterized protein (TIGR02145 family)
MKKILSMLFFFPVFAIMSGQGKITDQRDGTVYRTINIANKEWMGENLRFKAGDGMNFFDNDPNNSKLYGILYDWKTACNVCPKGWRLPSGSEYQSLIDYFEHIESWGKVSNDPSSFYIQLGGLQDTEGTFSELDESGYYWTSTEYDNNNAEYFSYLLLKDMPVIDISRKEDTDDISGTEKINKYSVRCIKE